jgi:Na+-transporting methylmalonyl-CoA/oxaloacetate decarboxylase gamma subunit
MGEWSEYFEDCPEENPANYVGRRFDPQTANAQREAEQKASRKLANEQQKLDAEIAAIVQQHKKRG